MSFSDFIKSGEVKISQKDKELSKSLLKTAKSDLIYLNSIKIDENSARKSVSNFYDVLRSILEAVASLDGYKIYSHEAFTYFLKEKKEDVLAGKFDRFRRIRNSINYYGALISIKEAEEYTKDINSMISLVITKDLRDLI